MESLALSAAQRTLTGKQTDRLRRQGLVPAVLYGHGVKNELLQVESGTLQKVLRRAGSSSLVDLQIGHNTPVKVLIQGIQRHPTVSAVTHIDFFQVRMTEKLQTDIELHLVGESPAVKEQSGILIRTLDKLKIECLPADLVPSLDVDISQLKTFADRIHVRDLVLPSGIVTLDKPDEVVASVTPPRSEAELEALKGVVEEDVTAVGVVEKENKEEETEEPPPAEAPNPKSKE
ncbi:MAG: 50S ribosomal protein L25 [Candidatus Kerfeldbacteria bacterium]|nr:50S ribosomal protein L25 [Candidatus Kerfeldbacteria bacterium]